jgi:hypothetical protein
MIKIFNWFKRFWCEHEYEFVRNIYGDEINECGGYRSLWKCSKCGKYQYRKELRTKSTLKVILDRLYDEYYENEHENWVKENNEFLSHVTDELMDKAMKGLCYCEIIMVAKESTNDRRNFKQWLEENKLEYEYELYHQTDYNEEMNQMMFKIRWK